MTLITNLIFVLIAPAQPYLAFNIHAFKNRKFDRSNKCVFETASKKKSLMRSVLKLGTWDDRKPKKKKFGVTIPPVMVIYNNELYAMECFGIGTRKVGGRLANIS